MNFDKSLLEDVCEQFKGEYFRRAGFLGYNFQVSLSKKVFMNDFEGLYVFAEFKLDVPEKKEYRSRLREVIPKTYEHNGRILPVILGYIAIPQRISKLFAELRDIREKSVG